MKIIKKTGLYSRLFSYPFWLSVVGLALHTTTASSQTTIKFTLDKKYTTSAGVYKADGSLVRTLWRRESYNAGTHTVAWDGKDDAGNAATSGPFQVKMIYHNVQYVWEGAIGNTSQAQAGPHVYNGYLPIRDMAATDTSMLTVAGFNEGQYSMRRFPHANPAYPTNAGRVDGYTAFSLLDTDGTNVYMANNEGGVNTGGTTSFVYALKVRDNQEFSFQAGQTLRLNGNYPNQTYASVIDLDQVSNTLASVGFTVLSNAATGLAVQKNGNILAVAHRGQNVIRLFDKIKGNLLRTILVNKPGSLSMAPNGDLWAVTGSNVVRYTNLDTSPTVATTITGFVNPLALATDPTSDDLVLVADGGTSQQVKAYNRSGNPQWTYGQQGGYLANGNEVRNDKLWFNQSSVGETTFLTIAPDHSFWVGDPGNNRCLHFSASRAYINQIMYQAHTYAAAVDANNPTRVFSEFLEFQVDYSRPIGESWTLVRNWRVGLDNKYLGFGQGLQQVTTLANGRTYAMVNLPKMYYPELVELAGSQLRPTGIKPTTGFDSGSATLEPDGSLVLAPYNPAANGTAAWQKRTITGFDATGNPQWSSLTALASAPTANKDPYPRPGGAGGVRTPLTSNGLVISFDNSKNDNYHLGAIKPGSTAWLWRASPTGALDGKGSYDIGNNVAYGGNIVTAAGRNIVYGYHGEFWGGAQASQWMHFYDNGLVVGQFGETTVGRFASEGVLAGSAGNGLSPTLLTQNGETYLWSNDEGGHGPIRWHLVGTNSIQEAIGSGTLNSTITLISTATAFPTQVSATPNNAQLQIGWSAVAGASSYTVRYSRTPGGPYITAASGLTTTNYTLGGLLNDTNYYLIVDAKQTNGTSASSDEIAATPYDPAVVVHLAGATTSNYTELNVNSAATTNGKPALQVMQPLRYSADKLQLDAVGSGGYVIYNWGGVTIPDKLVGFDKANLPSTTTVTKSTTGWRNDNYVKLTFKVDGVAGSDYSLYSNPAGRLDITVNDNNWHYLTAFCPVRFDEARDCRVVLTPKGKTSPAATYIIKEDLGKNHIIQFRFKGDVSLTIDNKNGQGGTVQAIFLDNDPVATTILPASQLATVAAPQLTNFVLVNADNGQDIKQLVDGETINLPALPTRNLSIRANASSTTVGSVSFSLTGARQLGTTDNTAPYTMFGDNNGSYVPWQAITAGNYTVKATPYTASAGTGTAGSTLTTTFTITDITKSAPVTTALYQINAGGNQLATSQGVFQADNFYSSSINRTASTTSAIANTVDVALYQTERRSDSRVLSYNLSVPKGTYTVILHFAETQWTAARRRQFDVTIEGKKVLDNYDIFAKAGANAARIEKFTTTVSDGVLSIGFSSLPSDGGLDYPTVAALQVVSGTVSTINTASKVLAASATSFSLAEEAVVAKSAVYPNPTADGKIHWVLPTAVQGDVQVKLTSVTGNALLSKSIFLAEPSSELSLDFSQILKVAGVYYLQLQCQNWSASTKVSYSGK
ncbi:malectin domain-containing carbohydrate-binding protein [Hymenobacter sp. BT559]|uniref:malectin domain-containing carbohydrate-binding protein n=1 Tax=Hymenobacter sp. BT559 TaxID=2795729 RepID=UPI0018EB75ED|nr:malectin domain-containing carbohydrate-binding protein [Hymenobacter sp. BT559]MBJ6144315.1 T9SS type A sorting domain-containing protein [Hymenobacter sp. BT559]